MVKTPRANTVGSSFSSSSRSLTHRDNISVPTLDLGDREAKTRWSFRVCNVVSCMICVSSKVPVYLCGKIIVNVGIVPTELSVCCYPISCFDYYCCWHICI